MSTLPPTPPDDFSDAIASQIEYYQRLREYHRSQWELADRKISYLKAFVQLELPDSPVIERISEFRYLENQISTTEPDSKTDFEQIEADAPPTRSHQYSEVEDSSTSESSTPQRVMTRQVINKAEQKGSVSQKANSNPQASRKFTVIEEPEQFKPDLVLPKEEQSQTEANLVEEAQELEPDAKKEDLVTEEATSINAPPEASGEDLAAAIKNALSEKPLSINRLIKIIFPQKDSKDSGEIRREIVKILNELIDRKQISKISGGFYRLEVSETSIRTIQPQEEPAIKDPPLTSAPSGSTANLEEEPQQPLTPQEIKQLVLWQIIDKALRANAPEPMNTKQILEWLYPNGLSGRELRKMKSAVAYALSNNLSKGLWVRVKKGLFKAIDLNDTQKSEKFVSKQKTETNKPNQSDNNTTKSKNQGFLGSISDPEGKISAKIQKIGGYSAVVKQAMQIRAGIPTTPQDICDWLDPEINSALKAILSEKFGKILSKGKVEKTWLRLESNLYLLPKSKSNQTKTNNNSQTVLELNSSNNDTNLDLDEVTSSLLDLFETEGKGQILHHNYIGHKIFGVNYKQQKSQLLQILTQGRDRGLWAQDTQDPNCWSLDLSLVPKNELEPA